MWKVDHYVQASTWEMTTTIISQAAHRGYPAKRALSAMRALLAGYHCHMFRYKLHAWALQWRHGVSKQHQLDRFRARHLFFPQLVRRTTIKQYGLVRNRNLLGHDDNILPFSKKQSGRTVYLYIQFLFQDYCVWSTLLHNKSLVFFSRSFFCPLWRHRDQEYILRDTKMYNIRHFNSERWKK